MKRLSKKTLWIIALILFIIAVGLIFLCTIVKDPWNKIIIILMTVDFILMTFVVQYASFQSFKAKSKKINYPRKEFSSNYTIMHDSLSKLGAKRRKTSFGESFLLIKDKTAYKISFVDDYIAYFDTTEEENESNSKPNKELDSCNKFIGLEIFRDIDEKNLVKLPDFSLQGEKIYYTALLYQYDDVFVCLNYLEPNEGFKDLISYLFELLKLEEIENNY